MHTPSVVNFESMDQLRALSVEKDTLVKNIPNALLEQDASILRRVYGDEALSLNFDCAASPWEISRMASSRGLHVECAPSVTNAFLFDAFLSSSHTFEARSAHPKSAQIEWITYDALVFSLLCHEPFSGNQSAALTQSSALYRELNVAFIHDTASHSCCRKIPFDWKW